MKKAKKILTLVACAVLLVCLSVGATIAYLTSTTGKVENTFTVGNGVEITLDEAKAVQLEADDEDGNKAGDYVADGDNRQNNNAYELHPGITAVKDPTIHVGEDSDDCWIIAKIEVTAEDMDALRGVIGYGDGLLSLTDLVSGGVLDAEYTFDEDADIATWNSENYKLTQQVVDEADSKKNVFYVYFNNIQSAGDELVLFEKITIPETWTQTQLAAFDELKIDAVAYAVQAAGFTSVEDAYAAAVETKDIAG